MQEAGKGKGVVMAHIVIIETRQCENRCLEDAVVAVYHHSRHHGYFCGKCAQEVVERLNSQENIAYTTNHQTPSQAIADKIKGGE